MLDFSTLTNNWENIFMKIYEFGDKNKPSIMLFPGTCCYWKTNFGHVLDGLQEHFHTLVVSYSEFDDTENSTFISELDEVLKVENYIKDKLDGKLFAAYGCSLGGSFVSLLIGRQNIHIDHGIIGSSDMDQAPKWLAKLETAIMMPMFYPFITGKESGILKKVFEKKMNEGNDSSEYYEEIHGDHGQRKWNRLFIHIQGVHEESVLHRPVHKRWRTHKRTRNDYPRILRQENGGEIS